MWSRDKLFVCSLECWNKPLVSAETVHHSSRNIVLYIFTGFLIVVVVPNTLSGNDPKSLQPVNYAWSEVRYEYYAMNGTSLNGQNIEVNLLNMPWCRYVHGLDRKVMAKYKSLLCYDYHRVKTISVRSNNITNPSKIVPKPILSIILFVHNYISSRRFLLKSSGSSSHNSDLCRKCLNDMTT